MKKHIYKILITILVAGLVSTLTFADVGSNKEDLSNNKNNVYESIEKKRILNEMEEYYRKNGRGCFNEFDKLNKKQQKELEKAFGEI